MSSDLVQLNGRDTSIHGRRYTAEERAAWYLYYRLSAGKSCRKVALRFNLDERTVRTERDEADWINRAADEDRDDFSSSHIGLAALVVSEYVNNFETHREIRDNPNNTPRDRMIAAQWMSGLGGISPVSKIETSIVQAPQQSEVIDVQSLIGKTPDELMRLEQVSTEKQRRAQREEGR